LVADESVSMLGATLRANILNIFKELKRGLYLNAIDNVSIDFRSDEVIGIAGESGSGKTTLLRIILRMIKPDEGVVKYKGLDVFKLPRNAVSWYRREVQPIFQDPYESFNPLRRVDSYIFDAAKRITVMYFPI
jgi:peptide/nickel transport system ATP-binding protein